MSKDEITGATIEDGVKAAELEQSHFAVVAELVRAFEPFLDLGPQTGAWGVISKDLDGMSPLTVTVTKAQMLTALAAIAKARGEA